MVDRPLLGQKEGHGRTTGTLLIDGDHRYESVIEDIELWMKLLSPGGIIALHGHYETQPECMQALNEKIIWSGEFEDIQLKTRLLIARKPN